MPGISAGARSHVSHAVDADLDVGEHRRGDALPQARHLGVDALFGGDVVAAAGEGRGQRVEQHRVDVVAHAEGEQLRSLGRRPLGDFEDALG